jgi:uncharacterized membrane protein
MDDPMRTSTSSHNAQHLQRHSGRARTISTGLGVLSIGLGLVELLAPGRLSRRVGVTRRGMRLLGLGGVAAGVVMLASRRSAPHLGAGPNAPVVNTVVTIRRPVQDVYAYFRDFSNLARFMQHIESVEERSDRITHWAVRGPGGRTFEWDAEIVKERPGEMLAWRSLPGGDVEADGVVRFVPAPGERGTEVHAKIRYHAPGGRVGAMIAKLFGREPGQQARGDLRRLKQVLETGGVMRSDASIHEGMHAAQPARIEQHHTQEIGR